MNSLHKDKWRGALRFSLICARINGWVHTGKAGNLRHHRAHYDVIVMNGIKSSTGGNTSHVSCMVNKKKYAHYIIVFYIGRVSNCWLSARLMTFGLVRILTRTAQFYTICIEMSEWWGVWFVYIDALLTGKRWPKVAYPLYLLDFPYGVLVRGWTTCLLYDGPLLGLGF